jgi:hypothetical protein
MLTLDFFGGNVDHRRNNALGSFIVVETILVISGVLQQSEDEVSMIFAYRLLKLPQLVILPLRKLVEAILKVISHSDSGMSDLDE